MSETTPVTPAARREAGKNRRSRNLWVTCGIMLVGIFVAAIPSREKGSRYQVAYGNIGHLRIGLMVYANEHDGLLPPTLWTLIPRYVSQEGFRSFRFRDVKTGEQFDWLFFPRQKLDGLDPQIILIAAPGYFLRSPGKPSRLIWTQGGGIHEIPEADFHRLIREQNPPPAK